MRPRKAFDEWVLTENRPRDPLHYDAFLAGWRAGRAWMFTGMDAVVVLDAPSNGSAQTAGGYKA